MSTTALVIRFYKQYFNDIKCWVSKVGHDQATDLQWLPMGLSLEKKLLQPGRGPVKNFQVCVQMELKRLKQLTKCASKVKYLCFGNVTIRM